MVSQIRFEYGSFSINNRFKVNVETPLSQIHHQLQNETIYSLPNKMTSFQNVTVQQQLQALSEMVH